MDQITKNKLQNVTDLLFQISDMNDMIKSHDENKFMQDEFSNRKSGLVDELKKELVHFGIDV